MQNVSQFVTLYGTAKTQLATALATIATLQGNLATLESTLAQMGAVDGSSYVAGGDVIEWFRKQVKQAPMGYKCANSTDNPSPTLQAGAFVYANNPNLPRDLSQIDQRPVSSTATGAALNLT